MRSKLGRKSLFPILALLVVGLYSATTSTQTHKAYILCQTKTSAAYEWYFSAIFMEGLRCLIQL